MKVKVDYSNLPDELIELDQWVCYDIEGDNKIPYTPGTDDKARSNDPSTFRTYAEALADVEDGTRDHLGFMLMKENGLVFIDLDHTDDPEEKGLNKVIFQAFHSFSERSISGKGAHIIVRGKLEGRGLHTSHFGIYENARGILVTGHLIGKRTKIQRANKKYLRSLQEQVRESDGRGYDFDLEETEWDAQPWAVRSLALKIYGDKFLDLLDGRWQHLGYPSQSEADHALVNMFCDISDSNPLVRFLFAESGLYREHKARMDPESGEYSVKGYLDYSIKLNRAKAEKREFMRERVQEDVARQAEAIEEAKEVVNTTSPAPAPVGIEAASDKKMSREHETSEFDRPTNLIERVPSVLHRELALFLYQNSYCPNQEIAILSAVVNVVMIAQRAYLTPTGTGCNLNVWLITETGWGKDTFIKSVDTVVSELMKEKPHLGDMHVGKFASGEGVETVISEQPRFLSKVAEAGAFWRKILSPHKPPHIDALSEAILNLFMSTGHNSYYQSRKKAKKDENIMATVYRPAGSFYGESTPEDLLGDLDIASIDTGLLQRQLFYAVDQVEYAPANKGRFPMSDKLRNRLTELIDVADNLDLTNETLVARVTRRADMRLDHYTEKNREYAFRKSKNELRAKLMNRAGLKALRLATLLAVGDDPHDPVIRDKHATYAIEIVSRCDGFMLDKFQSGDIGRGQLKQESDMMTVIKQFITASERKRRKSYRMNELCAGDASIIPYSLLKNKVKTRSSFAGDKLGPITAIDRCIDSLCRAGTLVRLTRVECETEFDTTAGLLRYTTL